jgi:DNA-binding transcriptional LysR family regulator
MPIRKDFPSLNALVVLEAAVRHCSFTEAATELRVTQGAVSRQIAMLEEQLGAPLFVRRHRTIEPTPQCQLLAASLAGCFAKITESIELFQAKDKERMVTIGATIGISSLWLLPRIGEFRKKYPSAQIKLVSQDSRFNLDSGEVDVVVRFGTPPFDDGQTLASRTDVVFPVCSPAYLQTMEKEGHAFPLGADLIAQELPDRSWMTWSDWFLRAGISSANTRPSLLCNHYTEVLEAARAGNGVALGWGLLVQDLLNTGALVRLSDAVVQAENRYNVVVPWRQKPNPVRDVLIDWLAECLSRV